MHLPQSNAQAADFHNLLNKIQTPSKSAACSTSLIWLLLTRRTAASSAQSTTPNPTQYSNLRTANRTHLDIKECQSSHVTTTTPPTITRISLIKKPICPRPISQSRKTAFSTLISWRSKGQATSRRLSRSIRLNATGNKVYSSLYLT